MSERVRQGYWRCPNCHRILGEIIGVRLVILVRRDWHLTQPLIDGMEQVCPKCHTVSRWQDGATLVVNEPPRAAGLQSAKRRG